MGEQNLDFFGTILTMRRIVNVPTLDSNITELLQCYFVETGNGPTDAKLKPAREWKYDVPLVFLLRVRLSGGVTACRRFESEVPAAIRRELLAYRTESMLKDAPPVVMRRMSRKMIKLFTKHIMAEFYHADSLCLQLAAQYGEYKLPRFGTVPRAVNDNLQQAKALLP